jgi:hypothetical protein
MSKLVFAALVLLGGLGLHGMLRRRADALPPGLRTFGPRLVLLLALGVPTLILFFSVFRIIPAGHVGVKIEEQKAEQKRYELIQAQRQAEIIAAAAKGRGDAAREEAKGVAEATRIKGDAEAAYNLRVSASLTPPLIQQQYLSKWDGRLPQYTFGGNALPLVQLPGGGGGAGDGTRR